MPKPTVYLETSVVSYLTAWLSNDLVMAAHQQLTRTWWRDERLGFDLYISDVVLREVRAGDPDAARDRLAVLKGVTILDPLPEALELARSLLKQNLVPTRAADDAFHIAISAVHGIDYLLTWNCKHIANAKTRSRIETECRNQGYKPTTLCTPEELMEDRE
jgi:hypothetical protein